MAPSAGPEERSPAVTVVVPTYNRADLIAETLESVRAQTFTDWECIVVDDGSTDDTRSVVEEFVARDPRFRYVWQENHSASSARNHGLRLARGEFIAFLDSDDLFEPDRLEWQVEALRRDPEAVLAYGLSFNFRTPDTHKGAIYLASVPDEEKPRGWCFEKLLTCSAIQLPLIRTRAIRDAGGFDTSIPSAEDWDMWLTLAKVGKVVFEPRIHLRVRMHSGNKSGNTLRHYRWSSFVAAKHLKDLPLLKRLRLRANLRRYFRRVYTPRLLRAAHELGLQGDWPQARRAWRAAMLLNPRVIASDGALPNVLWALLPTEAPPIWRARRRTDRSSPHTAP